ncbi:nucleotidyltransferase family protein [Egbenema bharatensis]|uniref:nucleotidyltransferase family protein n=1 Tax=Egbenema bharatensis TaxID=3463334 RepID=UPI003A88674E
MSRTDQPDLALYRETLKQRQLSEQHQLAQRFERAERVAEQAARWLKQEFGAERVMVFGSLAHREWFSNTSDIDLAVWGLSPEVYLVAVAQLQDLAPEFKVDLIQMERCCPELRQTVLNEGKEL